MTCWQEDKGLWTHTLLVQRSRVLGGRHNCTLDPPASHTGIMVFIGTSLKSVIKYFKRKGKNSLTMFFQY